MKRHDPQVKKFLKESIVKAIEKQKLYISLDFIDIALNNLFDDKVFIIWTKKDIEKISNEENLELDDEEIQKVLDIIFSYDKKLVGINSETILEIVSEIRS